MPRSKPKRRRFDSEKSARRQTRTHLAILAGAILATFATALPGDFVWIDRVEILDGGYRISAPGDFAKLWTRTLDDFLERAQEPTARHAGYWRPIYALSLTLDWRVWQDRAWCYHSENLLWHFASVAALYALARRLLSRNSFGPSAAFWSALIFAVHPLCVHSVTWISGRKDSMCAAFATAALLAFAKSMDVGASSVDRRRARLWWIALAAVCQLLALGCKELALLVPPIATVLAPLLNDAPHNERLRIPRSAATGLAALWSCLFVYIAYRFFALGGIGLNATYPADSFGRNLAMSATTMWQYVADAAWPLWPSISDARPIPADVGAGAIVAIAGWVFVLILVAVAYMRRAPFASGLVWFVLFMLPATGLVPLRHFYAQRYMYPALWGLIFAVVVVMHLLLERVGAERRAKYLSCAFGVWALFLAIATGVANRDWSTEQELFAASLAAHPQHVEARIGRALHALEDKDFQTAIAQSRQAIADGSDAGLKVYWSPFIAHTNLGLALYYNGQYEEARAEFQRALNIRPAHARANYHVGLVSFALGDLRAAEQHYTRALAIQPNDYYSRSNLAITALRLEKPERCIELLRPLVATTPDDPVNLANLASALLLVERFAEAQPRLARLVTLQPDQPLHRAKWAWSLWETGHRAEAHAQLRQARRALGDHPTIEFLTREFAK